MTAKEVTKRAISFKGPLRIPIENLSSPDESDIVLVGSAPKYWEWHEVSPGAEECFDENGCRRRRFGHSGIGEVASAPVQNWNDLESFVFPPLPDSWRMDTESQVQLYSDKYVMGDLGVALYSTVDLRGMDTFLYDTVLEPEKLMTLIDIVLERKLAQIKDYARMGGVDAVAWYDDWGIQDRLLISPCTWRSLFKSGYAAMVEEAHKHGLHAYWHCCGYIWDIVPDMVEIGVDVVNLDQPSLMGIDNLGRSFGGNICFSCPVDIQATLPKGDSKLARDEARLLLDRLGSFNGGLIAKVYGGFESDLDILPEVVEAYIEMLRSYRYVTCV
ncbi:MAG: hypothetical protein HYX78_11160 [Armatimonadetes bacterium]|nr:hypothetical protein [Armatimonadota bacterium]